MFRYTAIIFIIVLIPCIDVYSNDFKEKENVKTNIEDVQGWLSKIPIQDNPRHTLPSNFEGRVTWNEWINEGKEIIGIEECLLLLLGKEKNEVKRNQIVMALGHVGGERSVDTLIRILKSDIPFVQMEAAASLGHIGRVGAVAPLCEALKNLDSNVRANVCIALGRIGGTKAISCINNAMQDKDTFVQKAAKEGLRLAKRIKEQSALRAD